MTASTFGCSFPNLADVFRLGTLEYQHHQARFAAHKPSKYPPQYGEENVAMLQAFLYMDDYQAHTNAIQAARELYVTEVKGVSSLFKTLRNFVGELTTDKAKLENLLKDAGQQQLNDRSANDLEDNKKVLSTMMRFIQTNSVDLLKKDLPADFIQQLQKRQASLTATNTAWLAEKEAGNAATEAKTIAGNALKARLSDMFLDAKTIFQDEKEIAQKFVFDTILAKVRGPRDAGVSGKTSNKTTEKAVGEMTVAIPSLNLSVVSRSDGRYELVPVPAGTYDIEVTGVGFKTLVIEKQVVKADVVGRLNIALEPL
jgi:Carboxypeptidase regulatory-like domain